MKKILFITIMVLASPLMAGQRVTCPDLFSVAVDLKKWQVHGHLKQSEFSSALISRAKIIGQNTVTCKYANKLNLTQVGTFQQGSLLGMWQPANISGVTFYQCLASREECFFYGL